MKKGQHTKGAALPAALPFAPAAFCLDLCSSVLICGYSFFLTAYR
jgi:hypothetical protein